MNKAATTRSYYYSTCTMSSHDQGSIEKYHHNWEFAGCWKQQFCLMTLFYPLASCKNSTPSFEQKSLHHLLLKNIARPDVCLHRVKEVPYGPISLMRSPWPPHKCHRNFDRLQLSASISSSSASIPLDFSDNTNYKGKVLKKRDNLPNW